MKSYSCIIVDDEQDARESLNLLLQKHLPFLEVIAEATSLEEAEDLLAKETPDLLFLDVELGQNLIFELLEKHSFSSKLIFTTGYDKYALSAIKNRAIDYLLKPIRPAALKEAAAKAMEEIDKDRLLVDLLEKYDVKRLALPLRDQIRLSSLNEVIYCKADNNYTQIYLTSQEQIVVAKTLKYFDEVLPEEAFVRVHQSFIVNSRYIKSLSIRDSALILKDDTVIPVSRARKQMLKGFMKSFG